LVNIIIIIKIFVYILGLRQF